MERMVPVAAHCRLWVESRGSSRGTPMLLIMGANASGLAWPEPLLDRLGERHHVVRYDHRDTGRSTAAFDTHPYAVRELAEDAIAVLDALDIDRAHVVGMSLGGILAQLLLLDHPGRVRSATMFATSALEAGLADPTGRGDVELPEPDPRLLAMWQHLGAERDRDAELDWRIEHWRILNGTVVPFDAEEFRALEERIIAHSGTVRGAAAHAYADQSGLDRGSELAHVRVPTLVIEAPEDPINPPPHAAHLAAVLGGARLTTIPGMGHALSSPVIPPLAEAISRFTSETDAAPPP